MTDVIELNILVLPRELNTLIGNLKIDPCLFETWCTPLVFQIGTPVGVVQNYHDGWHALTKANVLMAGDNQVAKKTILEQLAVVGIDKSQAYLVSDHSHPVWNFHLVKFVPKPKGTLGGDVFDAKFPGDIPSVKALAYKGVYHIRFSRVNRSIGYSLFCVPKYTQPVPTLTEKL